MKSFLYVFADGSELEIAGLTSAHLEELKTKHGELIFNGFRDSLESLTLLRANSHSRGDGFKPGYNPATGQYYSSYEKFQADLKAKGLVETGNESRKETKPVKPDIAKTIYEEARKVGAEVGGEALKKISGEIA